MHFAHSPKVSVGIAAQAYNDHVSRVVAGACRKAKEASGSTRFSTLFCEAVRLAAEFHDLGKLDPLNQTVLATEGRGKLPLNHVDAGVAEMLRRSKSRPAMIAALLIYSHHRGLPDSSELKQNHFRDIALHEKFGTTKQRTDEWLDRYIQIHQDEVICPAILERTEYSATTSMQILCRIALSCLVDADHFDTSANYGQSQQSPATPLMASERLEQLDRYVDGLGASDEDERNELRSRVYKSCRESVIPRGLVSCDSPVGSGKTTAVMAHLLRTAVENGMRRIFVVLPYTNIITQSVDVYRSCLVLPHENTERVVAAHHHRAEFTDPETRHLTYLWEAPIIVTTAVQFFETLAAARTGSLRKLHQLANSAVFIDESHAALPSHLWPVAWKWLQKLTEEWNCHFVLGSGSLAQFWTLPEFSESPVQLPCIVDSQPSEASRDYETQRVRYRCRSDSMSLEGLIGWVAHMDGPRLLIVNTVQSAAFIAREFEQRFGRPSVEHLSTSLMPRDREITLQQVRSRLADLNDTDWTLVATSCVEAGVDISFRTGFRERASLNSLLQTSGRVNRSGEHGTADVWDFQLISDHRLRKHPAFDDSATIVGELFFEGKVSLMFCTEAMRREVRRTGIKSDASLLDAAEQKQQFVEVESRFRVIDSNTEIAVVQNSLKSRLRNRDAVSFQELQNGSVQIYSNRRIEFALAPIVERPGVYEWTLAYDSFVGYMAGVIDQTEILNSGVAFA